jgi:hypothetical protein
MMLECVCGGLLLHPYILLASTLSVSFYLSLASLVFNDK